MDTWEQGGAPKGGTLPTGTSCTKSWLLLRSSLAFRSRAFFWFFRVFTFFAPKAHFLFFSQFKRFFGVGPAWTPWTLGPPLDWLRAVMLWISLPLNPLDSHTPGPFADCSGPCLFFMPHPHKRSHAAVVGSGNKVMGKSPFLTF